MTDYPTEAEINALDGTIYFIACCETYRIKIGFTRGSPMKRLKQLQTGCPTELKLLCQFPGSLQAERELHAQFADAHIQGEWFELSEPIAEMGQMFALLNDAGLK